MICPVCKEPINIEQIKLIKTENFDHSYLYNNIRVYKCKECGHIFNYLTEDDLFYLAKYYEEEYAPINLSAKDDTDRPGSETAIERYKVIEEFMFSYINRKSRILDIGCGTGGLIKYLKKEQYINLYGIDPIEKYVEKANDENITVGTVYNIPYDDNCFDIVILDQVLEHLNDLNKAMKEIHRVLDKGGICIIGVPDAEKYNDIYFYLMKEHLQHFKFDTVKLLAENNEFEVIKHYRVKNHMIGKLDLPNLLVALKVRSDIYCFGIGREFMYLYHNTRLKNLDLILIDDTPEKQKMTFKGMKIYSSEILKDADKDSFLIITAKVHSSEIHYKARHDLNYKGEIINVKVRENLE